MLASADQLRAWQRLPVFVKTPIGTATVGVRRIDAAADLQALATELDRAGAFDGDGVLAQEEAAGRLVMAQSVFVHGEMVAAHANLRVCEGASGGASHKRSIDQQVVPDGLEALGRDLGWQGALSVDVILTDAGPLFVDVNPRLVEPVNAWLSGVDLVDALLDVATGTSPERQPAGHPDVATHQLLLAVLGAAQHGRGPARRRRGALLGAGPLGSEPRQHRGAHAVAGRPPGHHPGRSGGAGGAGAPGLVGLVHVRVGRPLRVDPRRLPPDRSMTRVGDEPGAIVAVPAQAALWRPPRPGPADLSGTARLASQSAST